MMQTFLPDYNFRVTAKILDRQRLGKQRVEAYQILNSLNKPNKWSNHPAVRMWRGYENALAVYMNYCIWEWRCRGYNNTMEVIGVTGGLIYPPWLGDELFHNSHKSNLLRKDPEYYGQFGWDVPDDLPYVWPI